LNDLGLTGQAMVLFHRNYRRFSGGHLKVFDYFTHVHQSNQYYPGIYFSPGTIWDDTNPWLPQRDRAVASWEAASPGALFLDGKDWFILDPSARERSAVPIVNLIQHIRHAQPRDPRYAWLRHKAVRVCVSEQVAAAIQGSGIVNGPVFVIPNGIDLACLPKPSDAPSPDCDVLIAALKQPALGLALKQKLERAGRRIELLSTHLRRREYLDRLSRARVTVFLPNQAEGFYLPALEGMALATLVVCPDCVGNRSFCKDGYNCLSPQPALEAVRNAAESALALQDGERQLMLHRARETAVQHDLIKERTAFLEILENLDQIW
jgi:hypothetical protein